MNEEENELSDEIISVCHQCGEPADTHTNCLNNACHLLFIQCESCKESFENCCSNECQNVFNLPEDKQRELRKGLDNSNQIFKKGRSKHLKYKSNKEKHISLVSIKNNK